jgi:hypothetical protein
MWWLRLPSILVLAGALGMAQRIEIPLGRVTRLASPDKSHVLFVAPRRAGETFPCLWVEDVRSGERKMVGDGSEIGAAWSADGGAFFVTERVVSDSEVARIYDAGGAKIVDVRARILEADRSAARLAKGHAYFHVVEWSDRSNVMVELHGHTDEAPVDCFDVRYRVSRSGGVAKISQRVSAVTARGCE